MMEGKINSGDLANKSRGARAKIEEGQRELSGVQEDVRENLDVLVHEASMDYMAKLKRDLLKAVDEDNEPEIERIRGDMKAQKEAMKEYAALARANVADYIDSSTGEVDMEKMRKEFDAFIKETLVIWYGEKDAGRAKISMHASPLAGMDYEGLREPDASLFGQYTINPETAGMNHKEKEPKIKILDMKEFVGEPRSKVVKAVVERYGGQYHIPGLEYEKHLLENPDKVPKELKDGNCYYFMGSTLRVQGGRAGVPCVRWGSGWLGRDARRLGGQWDEDGRVLLLER